MKTDLLGKSVTGSDGSHIGKIHDLVLSFGNGHLAAVVIDTGGLIAGTRYHAVDWDKAQPLDGKGNSPVRLPLSKSEVDSAPVMTTQAPRPAANQTDTSTPVIRQDSTGNISGSRIPAPAARARVDRHRVEAGCETRLPAIDEGAGGRFFARVHLPQSDAGFWSTAYSMVPPSCFDGKVAMSMS